MGVAPLFDELILDDYDPENQWSLVMEGCSLLRRHGQLELVPAWREQVLYRECGNGEGKVHGDMEHSLAVAARWFGSPPEGGLG